MQAVHGNGGLTVLCPRICKLAAHCPDKISIPGKQPTSFYPCAVSAMFWLDFMVCFWTKLLYAGQEQEPESCVLSLFSFLDYLSSLAYISACCLKPNSVTGLPRGSIWILHPLLCCFSASQRHQWALQCVAKNWNSTYYISSFKKRNLRPASFLCAAVPTSPAKSASGTSSLAAPWMCACTASETCPSFSLCTSVRLLPSHASVSPSPTTARKSKSLKQTCSTLSSLTTQGDSDVALKPGSQSLTNKHMVNYNELKDAQS